MSLIYETYAKTLDAIGLIGQGHTFTSACDLAGVSIPAFHKCIKENEDLAGALDEAQTRGNDAMADALIDIDNHKVYGTTDPKLAKVRSDNIKWVLARRDSKRFGDKVEVTHNVNVDVAITSRLNEARNRTALIEAEAEDAIILQDPALLELLS
jgi:hypothetical protein